MSIIQRLIEGFQKPDIIVEWEDLPGEVLALLQENGHRMSGGLFKFEEDLGYGVWTLNRVFVVMILDQALITIRISFHHTGHFVACIIDDEQYLPSLGERKSLTEGRNKLDRMLTEAMIW